MIESTFQGKTFQFDAIHGKGGRVPMVRLPLRDGLFFIFNDSHLEFFLAVKKLVGQGNYSNRGAFNEIGATESGGKGILERLRLYNPELLEIRNSHGLDPYLEFTALLDKIGFLNQEFLDHIRDSSQKIMVADRRYGTITF